VNVEVSAAALGWFGFYRGGAGDVGDGGLDRVGSVPARVGAARLVARETQPVSRDTLRRLAAGSVLALALLAGCVPASPDNDTYKGKVSVTLGGALSEVATVQTILETLDQGKLFRPAAIAQMRASQSSLDTNSGAFNEVNQPRDLDPLYQQTNSLLSAAIDTLHEARLAIERHQVSRYAGIADDLGKIAEKLDKLEMSTS
jgi:hypothetical protein